MKNHQPENLPGYSSDSMSVEFTPFPLISFHCSKLLEISEFIEGVLVLHLE